MAVTSWHREVARQEQQAKGDGWRVTPVILDGVPLLRYEVACTPANMRRARFHHVPDAGRAGPVFGRDGMLWAGDLRCPEDDGEVS